MPSAIDATKPADGQPAFKGVLRDNLAAAKAEVGHAGFFLPAWTGAAERTGAARFADWISVKDFGAVGNGVADDTAAIQAAIDHAAGAGPYGAVVFIPAGEVLISSTILLKTRVVLLGAGMHQTALKLDSGSNCDMVRLATDTAEMWGIGCLTLDGDRFNQGADDGTGATNYRGLHVEQTTSTSAISAASARNFTDPVYFIHDINCYNIKGDAFFLVGNCEGVISNLKSRFAGRRGWFSKLNDAFISNVSIGPCELGANVMHDAACKITNFETWGAGNGDDTDGHVTTLWNNMRDAMIAGEATSGYPYANQWGIHNDLYAGAALVIKSNHSVISNISVEDCDGSGIIIANAGSLVVNGMLLDRIGEIKDRWGIADTMATGGLPASKRCLSIDVGDAIVVRPVSARSGTANTGKPGNILRVQAGVTAGAVDLFHDGTIVSAGSEVDRTTDTSAITLDGAPLPPYTLTATGDLRPSDGACLADAAAAITLTVPAAARAGYIQQVVQAGAGQVTIAPGAGRTLRNEDGHAKTSGTQWSTVTVEVLANGTDVLLTGSTAA